MNSETNFEQLNNETARNSNQLPNLGANTKNDDVITPVTASTGGTQQTKDQANAIEKAKPTTWSINDFAGVEGPTVNFKYIKDLQEIFDAVLYCVTAPKVGNDFKIINHVLTPENNIPCIGVSYEVLPYKTFVQTLPNGTLANVDPTIYRPQAKQNLENPYFQAPIDFFYEKINEYLNVKRVDTFSTTLITNLQLLVSRWLGEGARDNRAAAENTASSTVNLMPNDVNLNLGYLDTFHVGRWLYSSYQAVAQDNPTLHIINLKDYIAYRNTSQPTNLPADTSLLALRSMNNNNALLGKLCIFKDDEVNELVILDYDNSTLQSNNDTYLGIPCRNVPWTTVGNMDSDIGLVLDNSLDKQTIQLALFLDVFHLPWGHIGIDQATDVWRLKLYKVPLQEALVRLYARKENEKLRFLCSPQNGGVEKWKMMYSFRIAKTMFSQELAKAKGCISFMNRHITVNKPRLVFAVLNNICPGWEFETYTPDNSGPRVFYHNDENMLDRVNNFLPTWIPYEMFLNNIHQNKATTLVIDEPSYEDGVEGNTVNTIFKFPRSFVTPEERTAHRIDNNNGSITLDYEGIGNYEDANGDIVVEKFSIHSASLVNGVLDTKIDFVGYCMSFPDTLPVHATSITKVYHKKSTLIDQRYEFLKCGASDSTIKEISNSIINNQSNKLFQNEFINDPEVSRMCYNVIVNQFLKPLLTKPFHRMFIDDNKPFSNPLTKRELDNNHHNESYLNKNIFYAYVPTDYYGSKFTTFRYFDPSYVNIPWIKTFTGKRRAARWLTNPAEMIKWYFSRFGIEDTWFCKLLNYPVSYVFPLFKKIKMFCHNHFDTYSAALRIFVDLETISGIFPMKYRMAQDDPYKWLTQLVRSEYDRNWWSQQFYQSFIDSAVRMPNAVLTLKEYVLSPWLWVTPGASKFSKLFLEDEYIRTKFGLAVSTTNEEKLKWLEEARFGINGQQIDIFPKHDETGPKLRYIANCQIGLYWIAGYILYLIRAYCGLTPKFSKLSPTYGDKIELIDLLREHRLMLPLDESSYDYHVTRDSWLGFIDFLEFTFPNNEGVLYFRDMFNNAKWVFDTESNKWLKGMPSGLALTSTLNSWMNYIKQKTVVPGDLQWAAGDDALVAPYSYTTLREVEEAYSKFGSQTNATKNWTSYRYGEYLKSLYGVTGSSGYPARVFGTLLYAQDMSYVSPANRLNELASLWKLFYDRAGLRMDERIVSVDLANAISNRVKHFNAKVALDWLHSPKIHGGFGKYPYNNKTFTWTTPIRKVKHYRNSRYRLPPVIEDWGQPELTIGTYNLQTNVSIHLGPKLQLPPILTEDDWVKTLNRENIPDRGPFTDMQLETVPLPVVDFISFVNMANFAEQGGYNVLPNLSGSWNTIASRLVLLSVKLLQYAFESLNSQNITIFV